MDAARAAPGRGRTIRRQQRSRRIKRTAYTMGGSGRSSIGRRYAPDCGTKGSKFLSRAAAVATRRYYRPGKTVAGERRPFSMCADFGCHALRGLERRPIIK